MLCDKCRNEIPSMKTRLNRANQALASLPTYHASLGIAIAWVLDILKREGFAEPQISFNLPTNNGRIHEYVGEDKWLSLTWYKMESGSVEVVAYVN